MKQLVILLAAIFASNVFASTQDEIDHLMSFIGATNCQYERNGDKHTGKEAVEHIKRKSDYYADDIKSAEDFIRLSATKSTMSGNVYQVHCLGQPTVKSSDWLLNELSTYRQNKQ